MGSNDQNQVLKIISTLKEFRTPIQLAALSIAILYLVWIGQYTIQQKGFVSLIFVFIFLLSVIPEWRKTEVDAELERRRINAGLERGKHFTDATSRGISERTRIESVQRKQGALDAFSSIERHLERKLEENDLSDDDRIVYQQILEDLKIMKAGADSFAVGFHERVEREMREKRGRMPIIDRPPS
jgi:hypothetical protein